VGRDSAVGIATALWARRSGDGIPMEAIFSAPVLDRPWGPPLLLYKGYRVFPGGKERPGRGVDHPPHLVSRLKKE